jgi:hypothetical protein
MIADDKLPSAPDLLIEAADTIGNRAAERDHANGERSMATAVRSSCPFTELATSLRESLRWTSTAFPWRCKPP